MTAHALKGDREKCLEAGMDGYVAKPIRPAELFEAIAAVLSAARRGPRPGPRCRPSCRSSCRRRHLIVRRPRRPARSMASIGRRPWKRSKGIRPCLRSLVEAALEEFPLQVRKIDQAIAANDAALLRIAAHTLKGSLRCFGGSRASELAFRLETMGRTAALAEAPAVFPPLQAEIQKILTAFRNYLEGQAS